MQEKKPEGAFSVKKVVFPLFGSVISLLQTKKTNQVAVEIAFLASGKSNTGRKESFSAKKRRAGEGCTRGGVPADAGMIYRLAAI